MQKKYEKQGFVLIAQHRQGANLKDKALGLWRQNNGNYTVTQGGNIPGDTSRGIPHAFLFDWKGKCVGEGNPNALMGQLDELMAKAPPYLAGGKDFKSAEVNKISQKLRAPKGYGKIIDELNKLAETASGVDKEEAVYLRDRVVKYGEVMLEDAKSNESADALGAYQTYNEVAAKFKGHEIGDKAKARLKELKKDKAFQNELKASKILAQMEHFAGQLKSVGGQINPQHPANRKPVGAMVGLYKKLKKKYSDTKAFAKAEALVKPFMGG